MRAKSKNSQALGQERQVISLYREIVWYNSEDLLVNKLPAVKAAK